MNAACELTELFERLRELLARAVQQCRSGGWLVLELRLDEPEGNRDGHEPMLGAVQRPATFNPDRRGTRAADADAEFTEELTELDNMWLARRVTDF